MEIEFAILYKKYKNKIFSYVYYLCSDYSMAEEICQDVFLKVYVNISKFKGRSSFKTWIYTIARNTYYDHMSKKAKSREYFQENIYKELVDNSLKPEEHILNTEIKDNIKETLKCMSDKNRTLIILRDIQNFSYKEISDITKTGINTVKVGIYRARKEFRKIYAGLEAE